MRTLEITLDLFNKINDVSIHSLILNNRILDILYYLRTDYRLVLNKSVIQLLKKEYFVYRDGSIHPYSIKELYLRHKLINFNRKRRKTLLYLEYLEQDTLEDLFQDDFDYVDLHFGI